MTSYDPPPPGEEKEEKKDNIYISPRLKAKLEGRMEEEAETQSAGKWIVMAMIAGIVIFGGWLAYSMMSGQEPSASSHTANAEEAAPTPTPLPPIPAAGDTAGAAGTASTPPPAGSTVSAAAQAAAAAAAARAQQTQSPMPAQPAPTETAGEPAPSRTYGIEVGAYLFEERAAEVQQQIAASTSLEAQVVSREEGGATTYAVVLGSFSSRGEAESKGSELLSAGTIRQSKVVTVR